MVGEAVPVLDDVEPAGAVTGLFTVSRNGSVVFVPAGEEPDQWHLAVARAGEEPEELPFDHPAGLSPRVSADGRRLIVASHDDRANLWLVDLGRQTTRRITDEEGDEWWNAWGPDGRLAFQSNRGDDEYLDIYVMDPDRPGSMRKVLDGGTCHLQPQAWAPDGRLLYQRSCPVAGTLDILSLDVTSGGTRPVRETEAREKHPSVSPDGRWLAFASDLSGRDQVYVTTYPEPQRLIQVSPAGGDGPLARAPRNLDMGRLRRLPRRSDPDPRGASVGQAAPDHCHRDQGRKGCLERSQPDRGGGEEPPEGEREGVRRMLDDCRRRASRHRRRAAGVPQHEPLLPPRRDRRWALGSCCRVRGTASLAIGPARLSGRTSVLGGSPHRGNGWAVLLTVGLLVSLATDQVAMAGAVGASVRTQFSHSYLPRLIHHAPAARPYVPESAALSGSAAPHRTASTPPSRRRRMPCISRHLRPLATDRGE